MRFPPFRRGLSWPLVLLLASLGVAALLAWQAQHAAGSHRRTADRLLHDYASIAVWSYGRHAEHGLADVAAQVLSPILHHSLHDEPHVPGADLLPVYRDTARAICQCDPVFRPEAYFAWTLGADTVAVAGRALATADMERLRDTLTRHVRDPRQLRTRVALLAVTRVQGTTALVAYGLMPTIWGDTVVYGFTFDRASVADGLRALADSAELLPGAVTRGVPNARLLALRVAAPDGTPLFASADYPDAGWPYQADRLVRADVGGLHVRATVRPTATAALVDGGLPRGRVALPLALLGLATALAALAVRQLRREQALSRLRTDFVASVSHELRTPLAQMRLFLETLRLGRWKTAEQRDWLLAHADREATRLSHLVENVLAFSRASRDDASPIATGAALALAPELDDAARTFAPLAEMRAVSLRVEAAPHLYAAIEHAALRQILLNLLDNAVKFGPPGQTVTLRAAAARSEDGPLVHVTVDDEGPGVPAAERARVWKPFVRGSGDATRASGGSGIGLAVVHDLAVAHGGRAWLEDAPGGGTRAVVELPAAPAPATPPAPLPGALVPPAETVDVA